MPFGSFELTISACAIQTSPFKELNEIHFLNLLSIFLKGNKHCNIKNTNCILKVINMKKNILC